MASAGMESLVPFASEGGPMPGIPGVEAPTAESDADRLSRSGLGLSTAEATDDGAALNGGTPVTPFGRTSMVSDEEGGGDDGVKRDVAHVGVLAALAALQVPAAEDCRSPLDATTEEMGGMPKNLVPAGWTMMYEEASPRETIAALLKTIGELHSIGWIGDEERLQLKSLVVSANSHTLSVLAAALVVQAEGRVPPTDFLETLRLVFLYRSLM